jgi:hypothetical protein
MMRKNTWNDYLNDIKCFLRWLFNEKVKKRTGGDEDSESKSDWETPAFLKIKAKKGRRSSPFPWNRNYGNVMTSYL